MEEKNLHTISSYKVPQQPLTISKTEPQKEAQITVLLTKLALFYYRPDFTAEAAKHMIIQMVEDLAPYPIHVIEKAIKTYRCSAENRFFPTPGQLLEIINPKPDPVYKCRLETFTGYPEPTKRATKTANEILLEHGFAALNSEKPYIPLPYATDKNGPVTQELLASKLVQEVKRNPLSALSNAL